MKLSENAQTWMSILGEFTLAEDGKSVKGFAYDFDGEGGLCTVYRDADCLRRIAAACLEVAECLEGGAE